MRKVGEVTDTDYIVVGAGSAGCLLANRLSRNPSNRVTLLEAGKPDRDWLIKVPLLAAVNYFRPQLNWGYETEPQTALGGRRIPLPRGKILGGTSSINGMMYMRGHPHDYDEWFRAGLSGWSFDEVLSYFRRFERNLSHPEDDFFHGRTGELATAEARGDNVLYERWLSAAVAAGFRRSGDFNGPEPEGVGFHDFNVENGRRVSSATAFLRPARHRKNLHIVTEARVNRLRFEGRRCVAVEYTQGQIAHAPTARKEVVLAAGVFNSPQLLQLSGIGPGALLSEHGIEVLVDAPEVGENFQDHVGTFVEWRCTRPVTLYGLFRPDRLACALAQYAFFGTGPASRIPLEAGALLKTRLDLEVPDIQLTFVPGLSLATTRAGQREHGFLTSVCLLRPESRGSVKIRSANPSDKPVIQPRYMSALADVETVLRGVRIIRHIASQSPMDEYRGAELSPGEKVQSDEDMKRWILKNTSTLWHGSSTCRMGADTNSVVDSSLRVRGIDGLRVADASTMPNIVGGNTSVPTMMIAEKCADLMLRANHSE